MRVSTTRSELLKKRVDPFSRVLAAVERGDVRALHGARVASRLPGRALHAPRHAAGAPGKLGKQDSGAGVGDAQQQLILPRLHVRRALPALQVIAHGELIAA